MSFVKREYVDQQTVITAENMNAIQDELLRLGVSEGSLWNSVTSAGTKASNALDNEAAAYNYHLQYHVGDYCLYQQKLYRCTVETPAAGETWNSSHWTAVTVGDEMIETASELSELRNTLNHKADVIYDTVSGDIASFPDGADGLPVKDLTVGIEPVQSGTGDPSPTNVRPISGWTGANVTRTGKNLINVADTNTGSGWAIDNLQQHFVSGDYVLSFDIAIPSAAASFQLDFFDENNTVIVSKNLSVSSSQRAAIKATLTSDAYKIRCWKQGGGLMSNIMLEFGVTASAYEPYSSTAIPISWQSEAGTVYGGTLDVTSGVLTVDRYMETYDGSNDEGWEFYEGSAELSYKQFQIGIITAKSGGFLKTNLFERISLADRTSKSGFINHTDRMLRISLLNSFGITTLESFKQFLASNSLQALFKLNAVLTYQLDANTISTLLGQNNIWADCGPSTVEYPCDTKLYIQKINTPTDDDMIADANIASGKYFIINNNLYLSTTAILAGDPIKPGTNCTATNLAAALNAINS